MFARYGMRWGGNRWSRPCRGRKATRRPPTSPIPTGSLGIPNGVSMTASSMASTNAYRPEPPMTPMSASAVSATVVSATTGPARSVTARQATFEPDEGEEEDDEPEEDD